MSKYNERVGVSVLTIGLNSRKDVRVDGFQLGQNFIERADRNVPMAQ